MYIFCGILYHLCCVSTVVCSLISLCLNAFALRVSAVQLAGRDSQVEMLTNYVGELRSKPASSIPGIGGGATKAGLSAAVLRVTAAQAAAPKLIPPKVVCVYIFFH